MSSSDDDFLCSTATKWYILMKKHKRKYHTHPINKKRPILGEFHHLYKEIRKYPERFYGYLRMYPSTFDFILDKIRGKLLKKWKNCHANPITVEEQLTVTLRYLSTGSSFRSLAFSFRMGVSTVSSIIKNNVDVIWSELQPVHMPIPTEEHFRRITESFFDIWNFPNCIGAVDGKHVRINCPSHSGTMYYNYKNFYSIVLLGVVDADYKFSIIDVGGFGKQSDGGTFRNSSLFHLMNSNKLHIPADDMLPNTQVKMPFVFIADEAFPLLDHLLKPYNKTQINLETEYFNKRLSRARKTVECAFGILYSKWRILSKAIETNEKTADTIIKAICILHNTIINEEGFDRNLKDIVQIPSSTNFQPQHVGRSADSSKIIRDTFKSYICSNRIDYV